MGREGGGKGGKLRAALSEIQIVPVPLDPITNQPFKYRLDGATAVLEYEGRPDRPARYDARRFLINVR